MNSSCLKVTVNGKKFLITGIRKEVLRKDLLCALAKTSDETFQRLEQGGSVAERHEGINDELSKSTSDENLLSLLKGDRETAGDYESLKILNSLGKNARIITWGSENCSQFKDLPPSPSKSSTPTKTKKHNRSKKKYIHELNADKLTDKRAEKGTRINKRFISMTSPESDISPKHSSLKDKTMACRTVDDSDLDSYKQTELNKLRKRQGRCYDDSDIDIYNSLYDIVLDQNKKLLDAQVEAKQFIKRASCLEESLKVYYIDDMTSHHNGYNINDSTNEDDHDHHDNSYNKSNDSNDHEIKDDHEDNNKDNNDNTMRNISNDNSNSNVTSSNNSTDELGCIYEEIGMDSVNNSRLTSPDYDSSESSGYNQTIRLQRTKSMLQSKSDSVIKNAFIKSMQNKDINENITLQKNFLNENGNVHNNHICKMEDSPKRNINGTLKPGKLSNYNEDIYLQRRSKSLGDLLNATNESTQSASLHSESDIFSYNLGNGITEEIDKEKVHFILKNLTNDKIINMGVLNPAFLNNTTMTMKNKKKLEKRKISKADISEPQLLSPTQFRRYGSLKNVQTAAMLLKSGFNIVGRSVSLPTGGKDDDSKEKEKFYNKKLLEVRRNKKASKSSGKGDSILLQTKTKDKEKLVPIDKPPGDKKSNRTIEKKHSKERDKHKFHDNHEKSLNDKKSSKSLKHRTELKNYKKQVFKREKSFDTTTTTTTSSDQNDDTRSYCSSTERSSSTEPDTRHKREFDIMDIEKQILHLTKLKSQQKVKEYNSEKHICRTLPTETSSVLDDSNIVELNDDTEFNLENEHDNSDNNKNENCVIDDALETTSDYSSLNENIKLESVCDIDDMERSELIALYAKEEAAVNDLIEKIVDYNILIEELSEELDILKIENDSNETLEDLVAEEENIYIEIDSIRGLLQSVIDLCAYQRKEMSENLALLDKLDTKVRTKKAGYEILKSGEWRTNSKSAPRSLLKYSKEKKTTNIVRPNIPNMPNANLSVV